MDRPLDDILSAALDYLDRWLGFQMRMSQQPGCVVAVAHEGDVVFERAYGYADQEQEVPLTPRHRLRAASHTKSFTAAGILKLREAGKLKLDDPAGQFVSGLHPEIAQTTVLQLLTHSAGIARDGADSGQFQNRRPFLSIEELRQELESPPAIDPNTRFKYSNNGYGLLGLVIEAVAGEPYAAWIEREIVRAAGLDETGIDMPRDDGVPVALGHSGKLLLGRRVLIPGDYATNAVAPAGGLVCTAGDLVSFFAQLSPEAEKSVLSVESRREMIREHWRTDPSGGDGAYGLGVMSGKAGGWRWFGHAGGLQGYASKTYVLPERGVAISVMTNAIDGWVGQWTDGAIHILRAFVDNGAPTGKTADWTGRWWSNWGAIDLVPAGSRVFAVYPGAWKPFDGATEIEVSDAGTGRMVRSDGFASYGEPARLIRNDAHEVVEVSLGGTILRREEEVADELLKMASGTPPG